LYEAFINASKNGQNALKDLLRHLLKRWLKHGSKRGVFPESLLISTFKGIFWLPRILFRDTLEFASETS